MLGHTLGRLTGLLACAASVNFAPGCSINGWGEGVSQTRTILLDQADAKPLHVKTSNGSISVIKSAEPSVSITAKVRAQDDERLNATEVVAKRLDDGTLDVYVKWPDDRRKNNEGCSFEISLPSARDVRLTASNGSISVAGFSGRAELETSNAWISVKDHDGAVKADTSNGSISADNISGEVVADTSNASVNIANAAGPVRADTSNGSIVVALRPEAAGPVNLDTSNGLIRLSVGPAFAGMLVADTSNAGVHVDVGSAARVSKGKGSATVRFTDASAKSRLDTSNGGIEVTQR